MFKLYLASQSPRRRELLSQKGYIFQSFSTDISEEPNENIGLEAQILDIAIRKARRGYEILLPQESSAFCVIAADTEVLFKNKLLGKPESLEHAVDTLKSLSGVFHEVKTAVVIKHFPSGHELYHVETTRVKFRVLTLKEIQDYVRTGDPLDKAGSYGIQSVGYTFVEKYEGSYENIVGLPTLVLEEMLNKLRQSYESK